MKNIRQNGFLLISLILALVIITCLVLAFYKVRGSGKTSSGEQGKQGIQDAKEIKQSQLERNLETQAQINSIQLFTTIL